MLKDLAITAHRNLQIKLSFLSLEIRLDGDSECPKHFDYVFRRTRKNVAITVVRKQRLVDGDNLKCVAVAASCCAEEFHGG